MHCGRSDNDDDNYYSDNIVNITVIIMIPVRASNFFNPLAKPASGR
jgi:hypothetical protein